MYRLRLACKNDTCRKAYLFTRNNFVSVIYNDLVSGMKLNKVINLQNKEAMTKTITFNELRRLKDSLPDGSTHRIADELGISVETVRNYFGGHNFKDGKSCGIHIEPGPDGGLVVLDDTTIFERALQILAENEEVSEAQQA